MIIKSNKRQYIISLSQKSFDKVLDLCVSMSDAELQKYINNNFEKANFLGAKRKYGAWQQSRAHRDKAKIAILIMDERRNEKDVYCSS